jgi:hypothetical protein
VEDGKRATKDADGEEKDQREVQESAEEEF